uniref:Retrotransposable element Tf2 protein type 2 n=1 Tax=Bactrocera latifrons TaxID=174628 RepID=A0A0K8VWM3_BACLA
MIFGNPANIICDRGAAFSSNDFQKYCDNENIKMFQITTGLPRVNGQVERLNAIIISVLSKLSIDDPSKWYRYVDRVQQAVNSTYSRSIKTTPFELLIGTKMRTKDDPQIHDLIQQEITELFNNERCEQRKQAKLQILKIQSENKKTYNLRRKQAQQYKVNDLVAIKRTQFGSGLKLKSKFLGPYQITKIKNNNSYDVRKLTNAEGPINTTTTAEYMKPWAKDNDATFGSNVQQDGRMWVIKG